MNNAILANIELSDTYLVNNKVNTNTIKPTKTPKGVKNKKLQLLSRTLKNLRFHKSEPFSDKNRALLVQF